MRIIKSIHLLDLFKIICLTYSLVLLSACSNVAHEKDNIQTDITETASSDTAIAIVEEVYKKALDSTSHNNNVFESEDDSISFRQAQIETKHIYALYTHPKINLCKLPEEYKDTTKISLVVPMPELSKSDLKRKIKEVNSNNDIQWEIHGYPFYKAEWSQFNRIIDFALRDKPWRDSMTKKAIFIFRFTVEKNGYLTDVEITKSSNHDYDDDVKAALMKTSGYWSSAHLYGRRARCKYKLPITVYPKQNKRSK